MPYARASGGEGRAPCGRAAHSRTRPGRCLQRRAGPGSSVWQERAEDGVCAEGQEAAPGLPVLRESRVAACEGPAYTRLVALCRWLAHVD